MEAPINEAKKGDVLKNSTKGLDLIITSVIFLVFAAVPVFFTGMVSQGIGFEKMILFYFLVLIGVVAWVTKGVIIGELKLKRTPLDLPIAIFLLIATISTLLSVDVRDSFIGAYGQAAKSLSAFFIFALFYYLLINNISKARIKVFFSALLFSSSLIAIYSLLQLFGVYILPMDFAQRQNFNPMGTMTSLTMFVIAVLPLFVIAISKFEDIFGTKKSLAIFFKVLLGIVSIIMLAVLFRLNGFTFWPAALVGVVTVLMFFLSKIIKVSNNNVVFPVSMFLLLIVFMVMGNFQFKNLSLPVEVSLSRSASWDIAKSSMKADPIFGSGPSTFHYDFAMYKTPAFNNTQLWNVRFEHATGVFFEIISTIGILGLISFIVIILTALSIIFISITKKEEDDGKPRKESIKAILLSLFSAYIVILVFGTLLSLSNAIILVFAIIGAFAVSVAVYSYPEEFKNLTLSFRSSPKYALGLAAVFLSVSAGVIVLFTFGLKLYMADIYATKAAYENDPNQKITYINKAISLNPNGDQYHLSKANAYMSLANRGVISGSSQESIRDNLFNAIQASTKATELSPNKARNNESVALIYENASFYTKGALEQSEKYYKEVIRLDPNSPTPHLRIGLINVARANLETDEGEKKYFLEEALKNYDEAINRKGNLASAHYGKAIVYEKLNDIENSISSLTSANLFAENNLDYRFELGRLYFNKGVSKISITQDQVRQIIENETNPEEAGENINDLSLKSTTTNTTLEKNEDLVKAEQIFLGILAANQSHANSIYSLAILYQKIGDKEKASQRVQQLLGVLNDGATKDAVKAQFQGLY